MKSRLAVWFGAAFLSAFLVTLLALGGCGAKCPNGWKDCPAPDAAQAAVVTGCASPDAGSDCTCPDGGEIVVLPGCGKICGLE